MTLLSSFPEGLGGTLGDSAATNAPFLSTGNVWYVHATTGTDAAAPAGRNRSKPLATLAQAQTNAANGDTVVLLDGHAEVYTAALAITKVLLIVGEGESDGKPTVTFQGSEADGLLTLSTAGTQLRNIRFIESDASFDCDMVTASAAVRIVGCYWQMGAFELGTGLVISAASVRLKNCTMVSTATLTSAQPAYGIHGAGTLSGLEIDGLTLDGGTVGWSGFWALDLSDATIASTNPATIENLSLLRGADAILPSTGHIKVVGTTVTGGGVIDWNGTSGVGE